MQNGSLHRNFMGYTLLRGALLFATFVWPLTLVIGKKCLRGNFLAKSYSQTIAILTGNLYID